MNSLIVLIGHRDGGLMLIKMERLQHQPQIKLILGYACKFHLRHSQQFFLKLFPVLKCKELTMILHLHQRLLMLIQQYALQYNWVLMQLPPLLMDQILLNRLQELQEHLNQLLLLLKQQNASQQHEEQTQLLFYKTSLSNFY